MRKIFLMCIATDMLKGIYNQTLGLIFIKQLKQMTAKQPTNEKTEPLYHTCFKEIIAISYRCASTVEGRWFN